MWSTYFAFGCAGLHQIDRCEINHRERAKLLHKSGPAMKQFKKFQEEMGIPKRTLPTVSKEGTFEIILKFPGH